MALNVMIALQTPDGLAFGYVFEASRTAVTFTVQGQIPPGTSMAWRMELKGYSETIMGRLTVTRALPPRAAGEWPRFEARVDEIPEDDLALLQVWMEDQEKGGTSRRMEKDPERFVKDMFSEGMRSASAAQTKLVIERMNERRLKREQMFKKKKSGVGGDFGLSRESADGASGAADGTARQRISAALQDFTRGVPAATQPSARPADEPPPPCPPSPAAVPEPLPWAGADRIDPPVGPLTERIIAAAIDVAGLQSDPNARRPQPAPAPPDDDEPLIDDDEPAAAPAPPDDDEPLIDDDEPLIDDDEPLIDDDEPLIDDDEPAAAPELPLTVDRAASPPRVRLRYNAASYAEDYRRHLRNGALFITGPALGGRGSAVEVDLTLPSGVTLHCDAQVVAALPAGTGLMLMLTRGERELLAREAG